MGHSTTVPGVILAADVPATLNRLKMSIGAEWTLPPDTDTGEDEPVVSMADRAFLLIQLLDAAIKAGVNVTWK